MLVSGGSESELMPGQSRSIKGGLGVLPQEKFEFLHL